MYPSWSGPRSKTGSEDPAGSVLKTITNQDCIGSAPAPEKFGNEATPVRAGALPPLIGTLFLSFAGYVLDDGIYGASAAGSCTSANETNNRAPPSL